MRRLWFLALIPLIGGLLWQIPRPDLSNPPSTAAHDLLSLHPAPQATMDLLHAACYDCHSHQTQWPWYAQINPIGDWVSGHVRQGRSELNFSHWQQIPDEEMGEVAKACAKLIKNSSMPLSSYSSLHPKARLSPSERVQLADYFLKLKSYPDEN